MNDKLPNSSSIYLTDPIVLEAMIAHDYILEADHELELTTSSLHQQDLDVLDATDSGLSRPNKTESNTFDSSFSTAPEDTNAVADEEAIGAVVSTPPPASGVRSLVSSNYLNLTSGLSLGANSISNGLSRLAIGISNAASDMSFSSMSAAGNRQSEEEMEPSKTVAENQEDLSKRGDTLESDKGASNGFSQVCHFKSATCAFKDYPLYY